MHVLLFHLLSKSEFLIPQSLLGGDYGRIGGVLQRMLIVGYCQQENDSGKQRSGTNKAEDTLNLSKAKHHRKRWEEACTLYRPIFWEDFQTQLI